MPKNRLIDGPVFSRLALMVLTIACVFMLCATVSADAQTRTLNLYNIHTKENAQITFKRGNRYDQDGLNQLNRFLRDWRQNEPTKMDPLLMDLLWEVYQQVGGRQPIHVVSAYRSSKTNGMLRSRSSGVADNSQHTRGKAIDFYIPGVRLAELRAAGLRMEGGGVGYYPTSGAPFVHLDTGNVRHWPRMRRSDLVAVFPNGNTIHVPSDGKPLPGYQQAMAAYKSRQGSGNFAVASAGGSGGGGGGILAGLFGRGGGNSAAQTATDSGQAPARASAPTPQAPVAAPAPQAPETIIASLPARSIPVPLAAPRPQADVGATPAAPTVATAIMEDGFDASAAVAQADATTATQLALVPLPTRRPDYTPTPAVEADALVASIKTPEAGVPIAALLAERPNRGGSDAISQILRDDEQVAQAGMILNETSAVPAVGEGTTAGEILVLAALPDMRPAASPLDVDINPLGDAPDAREAANAIKQRQVAALESSPRAALIARTEGVSPMMAIESGVRTTARLGKPTASDARTARRSRAVEASPEVARWALEPNRVEQISNGTTAPSFAYNIVRTPPAVIYTAGFQQTEAQLDTNRFSGQAVRFMSVARFN